MEFLNKSNKLNLLISAVILIIAVALFFSLAAVIINIIVVSLPVLLALLGIYMAFKWAKKRVSSFSKAHGKDISVEAMNNSDERIEMAIANNEVIDVDYKEV